MEKKILFFGSNENISDSRKLIRPLFGPTYSAYFTQAATPHLHILLLHDHEFVDGFFKL